MLLSIFFKKFKKIKNLIVFIGLSLAQLVNSIKVWTYLSNVVTFDSVRKEIHILSLTFTVIQQIRRVLNVLFQRKRQAKLQQKIKIYPNDSIG